MRVTRVKAHKRHNGQMVASHDRRVHTNPKEKQGWRRRLRGWKKSLSEFEQEASGVLDVIGEAPEIYNDQGMIDNPTVPRPEETPAFSFDDLPEDEKWTQKPIARKSLKDKMFQALESFAGPQPYSAISSVRPGGTGTITWSFKEYATPFASPVLNSNSKDRGKLHVRHLPIGQRTMFRDYSLLDSRFASNKFHLDGANLQQSDFSSIHFGPGIKIENSNLIGCSFHGTAFRSNASFQGSVATHADFTKSRFEDSNFSDMVLAKATFDNANFSSVKFDGSKITNTVFDETTFTECSFVGTDFTGTDFTKVKFDGRKQMSDLRKAIITPEQFNRIKRFGKYDRYDFHTAAEEMGLTPDRFEYMVLSGVIPVYDNEQEQVTGGFDPAQHHIPCWGIETWNVKQRPLMEEEQTTYTDGDSNGTSIESNT